MLPFNKTPDPTRRQQTIVLLHSEGWSVFSIAEYVGTARQRVYTMPF